MSIKDKLQRCFKEGEIGERHKGLKKIEVNEEKIKNHIIKAEHNIKVITYLKKGGFSDWSASAAFYTLYHCMLALCVKFGYESRNQSCTFALIKDLIDKCEIKNITKKDLKEIFDSSVKEDLENSDKILDVRERMQYSTKTGMENEAFNELFKRTKELFDKLKKEVER